MHKGMYNTNIKIIKTVTKSKNSNQKAEKQTKKYGCTRKGKRGYSL